MIQMIVISIFLLIGLVQTQDNNVEELLLTPVQNGDLAFLRALNSYSGCKKWNGGFCVECSEDYAFNDNKICRKVPAQCRNFNRGVGICERCYLGYQVFNGQCLIRNLTNSVDKGCFKFQYGLCVKCSQRWYFGKQGFCVPVSDDCRKWNNQTGLCTECYKGYKLEGGQCIKQTISMFTTINQYCALWRGSVCQKCAERAYFGPIGVCIPVNDYCRTWDKYDGFCLSCYKGYQLQNGKCIIQQGHLIVDMGCADWNWDSKICLKCSERWHMSSSGICVPVSDDCKSYSNNGTCYQCYHGYDLVKGVCILSPENFDSPKDLGCALWNWEQRTCLKCSQRWVFNSNKNLCISVSDYCQTHDQYGNCTRCYRGYELMQGGCFVNKQPGEPSDPGCKIWNWQTQRCHQCSFRWYFTFSGLCKQVSDLCNQFNSITGKCLSCFKGYYLNNGTCLQGQIHQNCQIQQNNVCIKCYPKFHILNGKCVEGNPLCKTMNEQGSCTSCFQTFALYKQGCVPLGRLLELAQYYAACCPQKLEQLKRQGRIV